MQSGPRKIILDLAVMLDGFIEGREEWGTNIRIDGDEDNGRQ